MSPQLREPTEPTTNQAILYPDASGLQRSQNMPRTQLFIGIGFVVIAAIIGFLIIRYVLDTYVFADDRRQANIEEIVSTNVTLDIPVLPVMVNQDDGTIRNAFAEAGYTTYEMATDSEGNVVGFDLIKLPNGVSLIDAQLAYAQGIASIDPTEAVRLLHGSWQMTIERNDGLSMRVRYADFTSSSVDNAVTNAIAAEQLEGSAFGESGIDSAGNTYQMGSIDIDGTVYQWQVSACPLSGAYSIDGLPENSFYVGIHLYR